MRQAVAHDHTYALSPPSSTSSFLCSVQARDEPALALSEAVHTSSVASFGIEAFMDDDSAIHFYTSFPTYAHFIICYNFLGDAVHHIIYPGSSVDLSSKTRMKSQPWVNFLYYKFKEIPIYPTQAQVQSLIPEQFKSHYSSTRIIIDTTEVFIQRPSNPHAQQLTFSSYKNHNTAKALAGITPSGAFSFISPLYGGSISDRELFLNSGLLEILEEGDAVMADKGFNIADVLEKELIETRRIASLRIHIERAFSRVKAFKMLNNIPNNMAGLASELFFVCAILTNFQPPLCTKNSQ
uniref:DDE Tnp4 domain-containing protein n=1 Tax=Amphimedon queenslandica TaxID=400682 RepID=A0A1X7VSF7_AMPQE